MGAKTSDGRKKTRFLPDPGTYALIDSKGSEESKSFNPDITALIFNESYSGCALVIMGNKKLQVGQFCRIKMGYLTRPMNAEVRWRKELYNGIARIGLKYLE